MGKTTTRLSGTALVLALGIGGFLEVAAQAQTPVGVLQASQEVAGKVRALDDSGRKLTLHDGTILVIPSDAAIDRAALRPGAMVKVGFDEMAGEKIVTTVTVDAETAPIKQ